jgi:hypothetical protein
VSPLGACPGKVRVDEGIVVEDEGRVIVGTAVTVLRARLFDWTENKRRGAFRMYSIALSALVMGKGKKKESIDRE